MMLMEGDAPGQRENKPVRPVGKGSHGEPRVVLLRVEGGGGTQVLRAAERAGRLVREEGLAAEDGALDREAGGVGHAGHLVLEPSWGERAGPVRWQRMDADCLRTDGAAVLHGGD